MACPLRMGHFYFAGVTVLLHDEEDVHPQNIWQKTGLGQTQPPSEAGNLPIPILVAGHW